MQTSATIQRRAASTTDSHGSPVSATGSTASVLCYIEQRQTDETRGQQNTARAEYLVVLPAGTGIDASDRIVIGSTTYQVSGIPWSVKDAPTGAEHHIEAVVEEVTG
jgi:hypothetical protein